MTHKIRQLQQEHHRLDLQAAELEAAIRKGPTHVEQAFHGLSGFANALAEHLLNEEHINTGIAEAAGNPALTPLEERLSLDLEELREDWNEFLSAWDEVGARQNWASFCVHSLTMLSRVRRRIHCENVILLEGEEQPRAATGRS